MIFGGHDTCAPLTASGFRSFNLLLARQFDSVWVFLIPLVLFGKDLLEPLCLRFRNPLIH